VQDTQRRHRQLFACELDDGESDPGRGGFGGFGGLLSREGVPHPHRLIARTTDPFDVDYYIGSVSKTNDTAEGEAAYQYQAVLWLQNQGGHEPAVIVSDSERALTAMDGRAPQIGDKGGSETYVGPQGGVNSVLSTAVHHI
jgi:ribonuclease HI